MIESYRRRSPLDHLGLGARAADDAERRGAGVKLMERPHRCMVNLRGDLGDTAFADAIRQTGRVDLPTVPNTAAGKANATQALWLGPDEWLLVARAGSERRLTEELRKALADVHAAITDVSEARTTIRLAGAHARDVLAKGTGLDLHPRAFAAGQCAQTLYAKATVILHAVNDDPTFDILVANSFAEYVWLFLKDAAREYGLKVEVG